TFLMIRGDTGYYSYGRNDHESGQYIFLTNDSGIWAKHLGQLKEIFPEANGTLTAISPSSLPGYYSWSTLKFKSLFMFRKDSTFSFREGETDISGHWRISNDTLFCEIKKRKGPDIFMQGNRMLLFFYEGKLVSEKPQKGEINKSRTYYPIDKQKFIYDWKHG
ncbi:MAG TPA: hypothetical protein VL651_02975, partial [Bacteroidia bacterium]|nr:hypothetical protein [Bacteroidia bacterium]